MSGDEWRQEEWEMLQVDYRAAVGTLALRAAELEHILHEAVVGAFGERAEQVEFLVGPLNADKLRQAYAQLYSEDDGTAPLCKAIKRLFEERNRVMHGLVLEYEKGSGANIRDRRRPREPEAMATIAQLDALSSDFAEATKDVGVAAFGAFLTRVYPMDQRPTGAGFPGSPAAKSKKPSS